MANPKRRWVGQSAYDPATTPQLCYDAFIDEANGFARSDAQVASKLGVSKKTLWDWRNKHPEFKVAYEHGKTDAEAAFKKAFLDKALRGEAFNANFVANMFFRQFGTMPDVATEVGETDASRLAAYEASINKIQKEHEKPE